MPHRAASVEAKSLSVGALLEERYPFAVPRYQRAYAWEYEAVADFVSDFGVLLESPGGKVSHFFVAGRLPGNDAPGDDGGRAGGVT